ncbi:MAG: hypothetical protein RLZZ408_565, partial [Verrucomicrobiota bacterium]
MSPLLFVPAFLIAGGSSFLGNVELPAPVEMMNHTLAGEKIPSREVVCRNRWGTPMLPDGKGGYSVIAPIKKNLIAQSLWIPPVSGNRPKLIAKNAPTEPATTPATATVPSPATVPASTGA